MRALIDTHVWLWWLTEPERIPPRAADVMAKGHSEILLSVASSWEIAIKYAIGKLPLPEPPDRFVPSRLMRDGIGTLHIEHRHALHVATLPLHHHDPFDRILIARPGATRAHSYPHQRHEISTLRCHHRVGLRT